jgi:NADPH:quinone reductase-like Zn-dependent oxidoreductase
MKAIVYHKYGLADVLELKEVAKPVPRNNEVLIRVHAASINSWDWDLLRGTPFVNRLLSGLLKPKRIKILGCDIAGRVEAVGRNCFTFLPGDEVFGDISGCGWGGFAEYVCAREKVLALKPASMTFEEVAAVPQAAVLALQGLRKGRIQQEQINPAQKVLINGAGGGVGSFAVPMAKAFGAEVTGVDTTKKLDFVRALGADHTIDYTQEDFTKNGQCYDLILDVMGFHSIFDYKRALSPKGVYVMVGGAMSLANQLLLLGPWISMASGKKMGLLMHKPDANDLDFMKTLFAAGKVAPVIDKCFPLSETAEAFRYFAEGHFKGKVVITMEESYESGVMDKIRACGCASA